LNLCGYCASPTDDPVAGSVGIHPRSLMTFRPLPAWVSRVLPSRPPIRGRSLGLAAFMAFASPSERSRKRWDLLSVAPPLMGFECHPPAGIPPARPLPGAETPFGPTLPGADSRSTLVVSHHLDGFLRAEVTGLLHPATCQGFAAFCACRLTEPPEGDSACRSALPATRFTPFEDFPSPAAVPHHCGRCLPAVTVLPGAAPNRSWCPCRSPLAEARDVHPKSLPWLVGPSYPEGLGVRCRREMRIPAPNGAWSPLLRRARVALRR
jgi:hypothetical protein